MTESCFPRHEPDVLLIGCGNMGRALAAGFLAGVPEATMLLVDPNVDRVRANLPADSRIEVVAGLDEVGGVRPAMTVLAIKRQTVPALLPQLAATLAGHGLVVSVAAGIGARSLRQGLPHARVVRAMPNTPALVGEGVTGLWAGPSVTADDKRRCVALFGSVGLARWLPREEEVNAVTAVSGSGPAYVFAFVEALARAGERLGLGRGLSEEIARATVVGAGAMMKTTAAAPSVLKAAVRSPGGTTDAALRMLEEDDRLGRLLVDAVVVANARAIELGMAGEGDA